MGSGQQVVDAMHFEWLALISFQTYNGVLSSGSEGRASEANYSS
jgi:hypothetical protein